MTAPQVPTGSSSPLAEAGAVQALLDRLAGRPALGAVQGTAVDRRGGGTAGPALDRCIDTFRGWLHLPDADPLVAVLAAFAANLDVDADPVWLLLVGAPGGGKTELLTSLAGLPHVHPAATLTEAALLSGTPKREAKDAKGGLLREIGDFGVILAKDFGSVLSMHRDARAAVLAALREVYDGSWTRHVGTDGGRTLSWSGKVGLIAGCTPTIDSHHAVMGTMGERFAIFRLPTVEGEAQARQALRHARHAHTMRRELADAVADLFRAVDPSASVPLTDAEEARLVDLAQLAARCRSAVERDGYTREIELIPEPEAPGRLALVLARLLDGVAAVGADRDTAWRIVTKIALDSMTATRRAVLELLVALDGPMPTAAIATELGYPQSTTRRALEDLAAHGVLVRRPGAGNKGDEWMPSAWTRERWGACFPDLSSSMRSGREKGFPTTDTSGKQSR